MSFLGVGGVGADLEVPTEFLVKKADMKINKTTSSCALIVWDVNFGHKILCTLNVEKKTNKKMFDSTSCYTTNCYFQFNNRQYTRQIAV